MRTKPTRAHEENNFYEADPFAWAIYTSMKKATDKAHKKTLWEMLTDKQKTEIKRIMEIAE